MIHNAKPRRAFATFTALTMMAIVGIALETLTLFMTSEARRTSAVAEEAQLQSLLITGADIAKSAIPSNKTKIDVPLPAELDLAKLRVIRTDSTADSADFEIQATFQNHTRAEHVHFIRAQQEWIIDQATFEQ